MKQNLKKPKWGVKTEWVPVDELPSTPSAIKEIAIDLETKDPRLKSHGPGWPTGEGEIVGIATTVEIPQFVVQLLQYLGEFLRIYFTLFLNRIRHLKYLQIYTPYRNFP